MSAGAPAIPAPGPFPGSHAPPIGQLRVARRPSRPQSGPLRAFQPQGHTPAGYPPETPEAPVNAVSKRRWLRALRGVGSLRVLGPAVSQPSPGPAIEGPRNPSSRCCSAQFTAARLRTVGRVRACSDRSGSMSVGAPAIPAPGPFPGSHAPPIGQLRVARRPNRPHSGPLRAFQPQGHTPSTPLRPPSTPFPSAAGSARSTAPPPTSIQGGGSVDDMAHHAPHRCRIDRNPTTVHSALGERLTYRLLQVQRSLSKEPQTSAVTCPPQPDNSVSRDDQPLPRSLTTTSHPLVSRVVRHAGDLQHRSGEPAHQYRVHGAAEGSGRALFDGRSRSLSGQCVHQAAVAVLEVRSGLPAPVGGRLHGAAGDRPVDRVLQRGATALGTGWSDAGGLPRSRGARTADGVADMGSRWQLRVPRAEDEREHNPVRGVIHNVHRIKPPLPRTPTPFYRHLFLRGRGALTITRIHLNLPPGGGPNLPLLTSIEMTPDASAVVTFHRIHWKGSPEYAHRRFFAQRMTASAISIASWYCCSSTGSDVPG